MRTLKNNLFLLAFIGFATAMTGCSSLQGKVENDSYVAPAGIFSCPIPYSKLAHPVQVQDSVDEQKMYVTAGTVRFVSYIGTYRIDYMVAHKAPLEDELNRMLNIQLDWYQKIPSPNAYMLHQEFNDDQLFAVLVAPEGDLSALNGYGKHLDLCRTMLIFEHGYYIYAVSADANDSLEAKSNDKSPERLKSLRKQVDEFARTIKFSTATN
ncbi:MAG TPA: hypothetical protein VHG71_13100 [Verrucomicrobiae bacterium]|nr:hypothetical protein [Verrucomicrobiae bacterium]